MEKDIFLCNTKEEIQNALFRVLYKRMLTVSETVDEVYKNFPELNSATFFSLRADIMSFMRMEENKKWFKNDDWWKFVETGTEVAPNYYTLTEEGEKYYEEIFDKEQRDLIWKKFCDVQYHVDFFKWLHENFYIKPKVSIK